MSDTVIIALITGVVSCITAFTGAVVAIGVPVWLKLVEIKNQNIVQHQLMNSRLDQLVEAKVLVATNEGNKVGRQELEAENIAKENAISKPE